MEQLAAKRRKFSRAGKHSENIVQQTRKAKINEIFDMLDSDRDGEISTMKIDIGCLSI